MEKKEIKSEKTITLFKEITELIRNNFVATYEREDNSIIMRIPNGEKFRILVNKEK